MGLPSVPELLGHQVSAVPLGRDQLATRAEADRSHTALEAENVGSDVDKSVLNPLCIQLRPPDSFVGPLCLRRLQRGVKGSSCVALPAGGGTTFHFVNDGIEPALDEAREAAGERDVRIAGGGAAILEYVNAGLIDEFTIALSPVLFGS